jgi:glycosyltransferase involved in cell wall biosynthesis
VKRVAWLFEYPTLHGGEHSLLATMPFVRSAGFEVIALAPGAGPLAEWLRREHVAIVPFETVEQSGGRAPQAQLRERLAALLAETKPDLLHANSLAMGRLSGPVAADLQLPSLSHLRDIIKLSGAAVADLNRHARLLAVSEATRAFHAEQGIEAEKIQVLYNGVDLQEFRPRAPTGWLHAQLGLPADALLAGSIGQLVMRKGHDVLARAAVRVADRLPQLHWVLVGARHSQKAEAVDYEAALHQTFADAGMADRVHFLGTLENIAELLPELTLLVHPSRQEPLGRVLLEAAASGIACIATDVGGTTEIFPPAEEAARLVPADNEAALANAIAELILNPQELSRIGMSARRRAEAQFDIRLAAAGLIQHYRDLGRRPLPAQAPDH